MKPYYADGLVTLYHGDALELLTQLPDSSVDSVVTDPPYGLEFMGKGWDSFGSDNRQPFRGEIQRPDNPYGRSTVRYGGTSSLSNDQSRTMRAFGDWCEAWAAECLRVLKPGGHLLAFGGTRTWHRLACAVEDAGFEVRDSIAWLYGSGFPKSLDVSKAIDKAARGVPQGGSDPTSPHHGQYRTTTTEGKRWDGDSGQGYGAGGSRFLTEAGRASGSATAHVESGGAETAASPLGHGVVDEAAAWQGWGTALKPAFEPIVVARKPLARTVAANVLQHGTGALNVDACRVATDEDRSRPPRTPNAILGNGNGTNLTASESNPAGRWPTNVVLDDTQAAVLDEQSGESASKSGGRTTSALGAMNDDGWQAKDLPRTGHDDSGGASRFFPTFRYEAKAPTTERPRVNGTAHPTVKPLDLMRWLVRLVTPPGGTVLEPFAGSGTTVEACIIEGFRCIAIERDAEYLPLIDYRIARRRDPVKAFRIAGKDGGMFDLLDGEPA